ncbi:MAG TPA: glycosyltransferase, partial [Gammaproteobacteria bacterium]
MRIALITPGFSKSSDDWCIPVLRNLAAGLAGQQDVEVYTSSYPARIDRYRVLGVPVHAFGSATPGRLARCLEKRRLVGALAREHEREPFDVLHGFWANEGGLLCAILGSRLGIPTAMTIMAGELSYEASVGYGKRRRFAGTLGRYAARRVTAVTTISRYHQDRQRREEPSLNTICLPFGVDVGLFVEEGAVAPFPDAVNLLIVGSLVPVKGHATALRALARVAETNPGVHLHIVGEGVLREELIRLVGELDLRSRVTFHGHVEHDELPAYYRAADFCLLSSHFETSGLVILEAAACGRVTVGSNVGSMTDFAPSRLRTEPGDVGALAGSIRYLIDEPETRR